VGEEVQGVDADAGAGATVASGATANVPRFPSVDRGGSVLDQLAVGDSTTGEVGGTRRTGSEIGNELEVGGTRRTGSEIGNDGEPEARVSRRVGTASAAGGREMVAATGAAVVSTTGGLTVSATGVANGGGTGVDVAATGGGKATGGAAGFGCVCSVQAEPSHQRMSAAFSASVYHPAAAELISPPHASTRNFFRAGKSRAESHSVRFLRSPRRRSTAPAAVEFAR
jgi:hypothetical protein